MVLDDLLDLALNITRDSTLRDFLKQRSLAAGQVRTEFSFPACDLIDGDRVKL